MDKRISALIENIEKVIVGKHDVIMNAVTALIMEGHVLIEDVPGVGKTQLAAASTVYSSRPTLCRPISQAFR